LWKLKMLPVEYLPQAGIRALELGVDIEATRILAGLERSDINEKAPELFETTLDQFGSLSVEDAARIYARVIAEAILRGLVEPYVGARTIWAAASRVHETSEFHELDPFIYAASEYEDRPNDRAFFASAIESEARSLLVRLAK